MIFLVAVHSTLFTAFIRVKVEEMHHCGENDYDAKQNRMYFDILLILIVTNYYYCNFNDFDDFFF
jgi:hypothetical protein